MKGLSAAALLLKIAGGVLVLALVKQVLLPGLLEFALITVAHLLLAVGAGLLAAGVLRVRVVGVAIGAAWGLGWFLFQLGELIMLFFVLPPPWLSPAAVIMILGGGLAAVVALAGQHEPAGSRRRVISPAGLFVFAALSSAPLWVYLVVGLLLDPASGAGHWLRVAADVAAALAILLTGVRISRALRR